MKTGIKKPIVTSLDFVLRFGKYKGWTLDKVLLEDESYVEWLIDNGVLEFNESTLNELEDRIYRDRYENPHDYFLNDDPPY
jgi:hypothetical protein